MERATGIGGVFVRARDPEALSGWYAEHLGVPFREGYVIFPESRDTSGGKPLRTLGAALASAHSCCSRRPQRCGHEGSRDRCSPRAAPQLPELLAKRLRLAHRVEVEIDDHIPQIVRWAQDAIAADAAGVAPTGSLSNALFHAS